MTGHEHTSPPLFNLPTDPQTDQPTPQHHDIEQPDHPYHRLHHDAVSQQPQRGETGYVAHARDLARAVCAAVNGTRWHAEATSAAFPSREVDQHSQVSITIDEARQVVLTRTTPAGGGLEQWTLTVDGQPVPHRPWPGEVPHHVAPVARSLWRHLNEVSVDPCDRLMCQEPATVATWGSSTCVSHAGTRPPAPRPAPAAAPSAAPLARPGCGSPPRVQPKGVRR
jgi:hypothetical protein